MAGSWFRSLLCYWKRVHWLEQAMESNPNEVTVHEESSSWNETIEITESILFLCYLIFLLF